MPQIAENLINTRSSIFFYNTQVNLGIDFVIFNGKMGDRNKKNSRCSSILRLFRVCFCANI